MREMCLTNAVCCKGCRPGVGVFVLFGWGEAGEDESWIALFDQSHVEIILRACV